MGDPRPRGLVGLSNLGNTCYMNAALQCLLNTPALADFFLSCPAHVLREAGGGCSGGQGPAGGDQPAGDRGPGGPSSSSGASMARAFLKLATDVMSSSSSSPRAGYIAPLSVLYALKASRPMFRGFQQHDSQEFLRCFMDLLHEELMEPDVGNASPEDEEDDSEEDEADDGREESRRRRQPGSGHADPGRAGSLASSSGATSPVASGSDEDEEYETADSGVSDDDGDDGSEWNEPHSELAGGRSRKRRHSDQEPPVAGGGDNGSRKREREDTESLTSSTAPSSGLGESVASSTTLAPTSSASDIELEFADAASSGSSSPAMRASPSLGIMARTPTRTSEPAIRKRRKPKVYRSIISDIFDGKLVSSVQCLTCDRVSATTETFQDLSLPIPSADTLHAVRTSQAQQQQQQQQTQQQLSENDGDVDGGRGWFAWAFGWVTSWFYGPDISLVDCLSYFFSADELKGDNMYSCERCKKLRNGLKYSRVTVLPDTLCIHLKRFRHDFAFSSKVSTRVTFPLIDLDMAPWMHKDAKTIVGGTLYDLTGVICHHGSAGGGHYTAYALNAFDQEWYEFDDSLVSRVEPAAVASSEAYVLFYRRHNHVLEPLRDAFWRLRERHPGLMQHYISKQWLNKLEHFAEPGPINNSDFLCRHGGVVPTKASYAADLCVPLSQDAWTMLHRRFGGGPTCTRLVECVTCRRELDALNRQKAFELEKFKTLHSNFQSEREAQPIYCLATSWFRTWEGFVTGRTRDPPGPIDNRGIITSKSTSSNAVAGGGGDASPASSSERSQTLRTNSDFVQLSAAIWHLFTSIYGGGPEVVVHPGSGGITVGPVATAAALAAASAAHSVASRCRTASESMVTRPMLRCGPPRPGVATRSKTKSMSQVSKNEDEEEED